MVRRKDQQKQEPLWIAHTELASVPGHPFYEKQSERLDAERFDSFIEGASAKFYAVKFGRPSVLSGICFRSPFPAPTASSNCISPHLEFSYFNQGLLHPPRKC